MFAIIYPTFYFEKKQNISVIHRMKEETQATNELQLIVQLIYVNTFN